MPKFRRPRLRLPRKKKQTRTIEGKRFELVFDSAQRGEVEEAAEMIREEAGVETRIFTRQGPVGPIHEVWAHGRKSRLKKFLDPKRSEIIQTFRQEGGPAFGRSSDFFGSGVAGTSGRDRLSDEEIDDFFGARPPDVRAEEDAELERRRRSRDPRDFF